MKTIAEECKELTDKVPLLFHCELYPINSANLSQGWENETCNFGYEVGFFSFQVGFFVFFFFRSMIL